MFAHQVIGDVEKGLAIAPLFKNEGISEDKKKLLSKYRDKTLSFLPTIKKAQKFYGGDVRDILSLFPKNDATKLFKSPMADRWRLPYKNFWCDFIWGKGRAGIVAFEILPDLFGAGFVMKPHISECSFPDTPFFSFLPIWAIVSIRENLGDRKDRDSLAEKVSALRTPNGVGNIALLTLGIPREELLDTVEDEVFMLLEVFEKFVYLLNCKNIVTEKIKTPEALNRKRRRSGKQELFEYHVLSVVVPSKKSGYSEPAVALSHNRVHLCRGHFKEYTAERPLFGQYIGLYWWQPHARGQNKEGIVIKDYKIKKTNEGDRVWS